MAGRADGASGSVKAKEQSCEKFMALADADLEPIWTEIAKR
jgi:hypothetical protein